MNEYKITYEAPPVSEIPKIVYIDAHTITEAAMKTLEKLGAETLVYKIELV